MKLHKEKNRTKDTQMGNWINQVKRTGLQRSWDLEQRKKHKNIIFSRKFWDVNKKTGNGMKRKENEKKDKRFELREG